MSAMSLSDDLLSGESYYIVEIRTIKRILDSIRKDGHILCFVDEVLRGTNTVERIAAGFNSGRYRGLFLQSAGSEDARNFAHPPRF